MDLQELAGKTAIGMKGIIASRVATIPAAPWESRRYVID
jgi:hypothetical protein